jgi:hypothetical protein
MSSMTKGDGDMELVPRDSSQLSSRVKSPLISEKAKDVEDDDVTACPLRFPPYLLEMLMRNFLLLDHREAYSFHYQLSWNVGLVLFVSLDGWAVFPCGPMDPVIVDLVPKASVCTANGR